MKFFSAFLAFLVLALAALPVRALDPGKIVVIKQVINDNGGSKAAGDFTIQLYAKDVTRPAEEPMILWTEFPGPLSPGTEIAIGATEYQVQEVADSGYTVSYSSDCTGSVMDGEVKTCTVTNNDKPARLTVVKEVINDNGGSKAAGDFTIKVSGVDLTAADPSILSELNQFPGATSGTTIEINAGQYAVTEIPDAGYDASFSSACSGTALPGQNITCTVTNNDKAPSEGGGGGPAPASGGGGGGGGGESPTFQISGYVFEDLNLNKVKDGTDTGQSGWQVFSDGNGNGVWDAGEPVALTDNNGYYALYNVLMGKHDVLLTGQPGWSVNFPPIGDQHEHSFELTAQQPQAGDKNFAVNTQGVVMGAQTTEPADAAVSQPAPAVMGAATTSVPAGELPRTGLPVLPLFGMALGTLGLFSAWRKFNL